MHLSRDVFNSKFSVETLFLLILRKWLEKLALVPLGGVPIPSRVQIVGGGGSKFIEI